MVKSIAHLTPKIVVVLAVLISCSTNVIASEHGMLSGSSGFCSQIAEESVAATEFCPSVQTANSTTNEFNIRQTYTGSCGGWVKDANGRLVQCSCRSRPVCFDDGTCGCSLDNYCIDTAC